MGDKYLFLYRENEELFLKVGSRAKYTHDILEAIWGIRPDWSLVEGACGHKVVCSGSKDFERIIGKAYELSSLEWRRRADEASAGWKRLQDIGDILFER